MEELHFEPSFHRLDLSQKAFQLLDDISQNFQETMLKQQPKKEKIAPPAAKNSARSQEQKAPLKERQLQAKNDEQAKTNLATRALSKQQSPRSKLQSSTVQTESLSQEQQNFESLEKIVKHIEIPTDEHKVIVESLKVLLQQAHLSMPPNLMKPSNNEPALKAMVKVKPGSDLSRHKKAQKATTQKTLYQEKIEDLKQKIARQMRFELKMALKKGLGEVRMRLKPEVLGQVKIQLILEQGSARAHFQVESQSVKELMLSESKQLEDALLEGGFESQEIDVQVDERGQGKSSDQELLRDWINSFEELEGDEETALFDTEDFLEISL